MRVFIISLGTGTGTGGGESLAKGIIAGIKAHRPEKMLFLASGESKSKTFPMIEASVGKIPYDFLLTEDIDNIDGIFKECSDKIKELQKEGHSIVVDFTSGTKAMSAGLALAGFLNEVDSFAYTSGTRIDGKVAAGTEKPQEYYPEELLLEKRMNEVKLLFNRNQFAGAEQILAGFFGKSRTASQGLRNEFMEKCSNAADFIGLFINWDLFKHMKAFDKARKFEGLLPEHYKFLEKIAKGGRKDPEVMYYQLIDLIENAKRRVEEGKFDDANARCYRALELAAQIQLMKKHGIDASNVEVSLLPSAMRPELEKKTNAGTGKIQIALNDDFKLLQQLNDPMGEKFIREKTYGKLNTRNHSILAHGLEPVSEPACKGLLSLAEEYAAMLEFKAQGTCEFPKVKGFYPEIRLYEYLQTSQQQE